MIHAVGRHRTPRSVKRVNDVDADRAVGWDRCRPEDAEFLGVFNAEFAKDEGPELIGPVATYVERMRGWLHEGRYQAPAAGGTGGWTHPTRRGAVAQTIATALVRHHDRRG